MTEEMGTKLRQTLQGLCFDTSWNYAVFWKLKRGTCMNLAWEDGYINEYVKTPVVLNVSAYMTHGFPLSGMGCGQEGGYAQDGFSVGDQIGRAVAQMSCQVFTFGEGTIGSVAFTDKHQWIFGDKNCVSELNHVGSVYGRILLEYPIEWQDQFAAGIKTIAVIAVMPHGVVQLGSTQMIMEDLNFVNQVKEQVKEDLDFVNHVKDEFGIFQNIPKSFLPNNNLDGQSGKIEGSLFQKMSIPLTSLGNAASLGVTNATPSEDNSNASVLKIPSSDILDKFISPANLVEKNKSLPSCTLALPSDGASTGTVNHLSSFQQNNAPLNNLLAHIADKKGSETGNAIIVPSTSRVYPFKGQMPTNIALPDRQQTLNMGSSSIFMEQPQFQGKMAFNFPDDCILNSICGAKSINAERLGQDSFNITHKDDRLQETALDVQPSGPLFQDSVGQSGYSTLAARLLERNINKTKKEATAMPVVKVDTENITYTSPSLSSANMGMAISDNRQSCNVQWSASAGCHNTKMLKNLSNGLATSLGYQNVSVSNTVGLDHSSWQKEVIGKNIAEHLSDNGIHGMNPVKEVSKSAMTDLSKYSAILADFDNPDVIEFGSSDNSRNLPSKGQNKTMHAISCIPSSVELLEALRPTFKAPDNSVWDEMLFHRGVSSTNLGNQNFGVSPCSDYHSEDVNKKSDLSIMTATEGWFLPETKSEDLLDAVVANRCLRTNQGVDDNISCKTTFSSTTNLTPVYCSSAKSDNCSVAQVSASEKEQSMAVDISKPRESLDLGDCTNRSFSSMFHEDIGVKMFANESSINSMPKSLVNDAHCENNGFTQAKRPGEPIKGNRKRAKPGESSRPRPKDRQQIQDRLKELREIIPNGAKCSIDTLLERTIKHMHFLQSVTKYADKLKLTGKSKVLDEEVALLASTMEGGASWAFELGGQAVGCPIIVENLNQARQMLVEMLCEERGLFLEIADIIRNLGLTILKGIMEARNDKIWARFVVEADRDVHRVEILWSLMQLLQPNTKGSSTSNHSSLANSQVTENVSQTFDTFQLSPMVCGP
ncbi:uncharacterized protein LOC131071279 isoform X1 [Cryptomeria japonica]|uniref:uncharacterized protein LOC131071279 isoform X1 n=1 Tax=Cryptomeria japonica TaxID=3369 RepID=UPI0025AB8100|nr:uncharacterized protein LOC131071279 isoform X1 [Cryptomeria japonica]